MTNPLDQIAAHVVGARTEDLPPEVVAKVKTFLLDTFGVGIAGSSGTGVAELIEVARGWGAEPEASVLGSDVRMCAGSAAVVNAYQIHCLEFDCVHEGAVLHPMATIMGAVMAWSEREAGRGRPVSGNDLIAALAVGVDVSTMLGIVTNAELRFFRPATAGGFGAVAAIGRLAGFDERQMQDAFGAQYSQTSGTLQAHAEGSPMLGMQVGFNARAAIMSADLAAAGFRGPHDILTGQYGYYRLFEQDDHDIGAFLPSLGKDWQILNMSHKPYPSGRLTHGAIDGLGQLMAQHGFAADDIESIEALVPPLVHRLVGRPIVENPEANYAKLCLAFVAGTFLARGNVDVPDFRGDALNDPAVQRYGKCVSVVLDGNPDLNALDPQRITVQLRDGTRHVCDLPYVYGHPKNPLTEAENLAKFRRCAGYASAPLPDAAQDKLISAIAGLERLDNIADLMALTRGAAQ
jgi:2-methylcitrate dehydratase PrpD